MAEKPKQSAARQQTPNVVVRSDKVRGNKASSNRRYQAETSSLSWLHLGGKKKQKGTKKNNPPVMVRGGRSMAEPGRDSGRHSQSAVKPRYDVMVPRVPGAAISLPVIPQVAWGWRVISFALFVALAFGIYYAWTSPYFMVENVEYQGLQRVWADDVDKILDVSGKPSFLLNPDQLQVSLEENFPEFSKVAVQVDLPNLILVTVEERTPVLVWNQDGRTDLVDVEGIAFPPRSEELNSSLPTVEASGQPIGLTTIPTIAEFEAIQVNADEGSITDPIEPSQEKTRQILTADMVKAILFLADQVPQDTSLLYTQEHGFGWKVPDAYEVFFGDAADMDKKLLIYYSILEHLDSLNVRASLISVEWVDSPYYRLEP